jgi:FkbM family methyltransferase
MKEMIRALLRRLGFIIVSRNNAATRYIENPPSCILDEILFRTFPDLHGLQFIQIGANDGRRADPIHRHVLTHAWTGVLVEPLLAYFEKLKENYATTAGLRFVQAALGVPAGQAEIFQLRPDLKNLPDWAWGLASLDIERVRTAAAELELDDHAIVAQSVPVITWRELLREGDVTRCDVLIIDTEGRDIPILRSAPLAELAPRVIQFEHGCSSKTERLAIYGDLLAMGFELATDGSDTIAFRPLNKVSPLERSH